MRQMMIFLYLLGWAAVVPVGAQPLPEPDLAHASQTSEPSSLTQKFVLENGLSVLVSPMPQSASVSIFGVVKTGSAFEQEYLGSGISHFMEHMLFKGTQRRGVGEIPREVQSLGGTINASTHMDYTIYTLTLPKAHFQEGMDILSDMLMNARFDAQDIETERDVIFREMHLYRDHPVRYLSEKVFATVYTRHPYRLPIIGFEDLLKPLTRDDFLAYYQSRYAPNNMVLSIAGAVTPDEARSSAQACFGAYPRRSSALRNLPREPRQTTSRYAQEFYPAELMYLSVVYPGVDVMDPDMPALDAVAMILGEGEGSRLYQSLYHEKKLVHRIEASDFTPYDPGVFEIAVEADSDRVSEILAAIDHEIENLITQGVTQQELDKIVSSSLKAVCERQLKSDQMAWQAGVDEALTGQYDFTQWYFEALQKVSPEDVVRAAQTYLRPQRRSVVVLKPRAWMPEDEGSAADEPVSPKIERVVLSNGLTVLLRRDPTVPMVWLDLAFHGGVYADPSGLSGLSNLTVHVWEKGSQQFPYKELSAITERRGISLEAFSGRQSFGLRMDFLSRDSDQALAICADLVRHPLFESGLFEDERRQMVTMIQSRNDQMSEIADRMIYAELFRGHPAARIAIGTQEDVRRITREAVVEFYRQHAAPSAAVLSVFGDFDRDRIVEKLEALFGSWQGAETSLPMIPDVTPLSRPVSLTHRMDKEQALVAFGFQAQGIAHPDRAGLELLGALLGSPFNGRMFSQIREAQGLAYTLGGGLIPFKTTGALMFFVKTRPEQTAQVRQTFLEQIADLAAVPVTATELNQVRAWLIGGQERALETSAGMAFTATLNELYGLGYRYHQDYAARLEAVTPAEIQRLAQEYLTPERMVSVTILPQEATAAGDDATETTAPSGDEIRGEL